MNNSAQITTKNGRLIARISLIFFILANFIWLFDGGLVVFSGSV